MLEGNECARSEKYGWKFKKLRSEEQGVWGEGVNGKGWEIRSSLRPEEFGVRSVIGKG